MVVQTLHLGSGYAGLGCLMISIDHIKNFYPAPRREQAGFLKHILKEYVQKRAQERSGHGIGDVDYPTERVATNRIDEAVAHARNLLHWQTDWSGWQACFKGRRD